MGAPAITSNIKAGSRIRIITIAQSGVANGTVMFELPEPIFSMSVHLTGTTDGLTAALQCGNDGVVANVKAMPTAVAFANAVGVLTVARADLGFRYYAIAVSSSGSSSTIVITLVAKLAY